jgi:uncharacterized protein YecE (DUF72 family)
MAGVVRVGISGWRYPPWRGVFYPKGLPQRAELSYAASRLSTIEINGSFYSLQRPESYRAWHAQTPPGFVFAVKGGRFLTHMKKLRGVESALANFFASGLLALGDKLGPVLWQLPPNLGFDAERLAAFFAQLPRSTAEAAWLARRHDERLAGRSLVTAVGDAELYVSGYSAAALDQWAATIRPWAAAGHDVFVYFDNDVKVRAPFDAMALAERFGRSGSEGFEGWNQDSPIGGVTS